MLAEGPECDQEALSVARDVVKTGITREGKPKQRMRRNHAEVLSRLVYLDGNKYLVGIHIEEFLAVATPARIISTRRRDGNPRTGPGKWRDVDLVVAEIVVGNPASIR